MQYEEKKNHFRELTFQYILKLHDGAFMPEPLAREIEEKTGLTVYEILRDEKLYPVKSLISLWRSYLDGNSMQEWFFNEKLCAAGKMLLIKIAQTDVRYYDQITPYLSDTSDTVQGYAAYVLKNAEVLKSICEKTNNFVLLMFIADLISTWKPKDIEPYYDILMERCLTENELEIDERFRPGMLSGLFMLDSKLKRSVKDLKEGGIWSKDNVINSYMVIETMDRENDMKNNKNME